MPLASSRRAPKTRKETMNGIWRSPVLKPKSATWSGQRITTNTLNIISDRCARTKNGRKRRCRDGPPAVRALEVTNSEVLECVLLGRVSLENVNWNRGVRQMTDSGGLSWEAQEVLQKIKSFNRLPGAGIPLIQLNMRVGSAKTVKKGIPELESAGLIADAASGELTLTDKGYKTSV